ncbi:MAG: FAD-dependent monooxygenase [Bdellovibrionota bacterium]
MVVLPALYFLGYDGQPGFDDLNSEDQVNTFFKREFPDAFALIGNVSEQFFANPTGSLATIRCDPWNIDNHVLLLGDAAHAIVPFFGQGMNASFEDVQLFFQQFDQVGIDQAIVGFSKLRKKDADAIALMALENFVEMRDSVSDPSYLARRKIAQKLEKENPDSFQSRYTMVSFTSIPYAEVYQRGVENQKIIDTYILQNKAL